eukprot:CAMPEP_0184498758 /NCGR_PEP_ID=MMETSP0113_2-20130426/39765_1 /TAXON_ID=91329 /ORGANISM="Norrisiella sphaerica, Strain BC52" /LENGTH=242 /DNA_ID=CAMNT_0026886403 /DNA_START=12 /DNA_END=737 /DNA_ORIENTATION=+
MAETKNGDVYDLVVSQKWVEVQTVLYEENVSTRKPEKDLSVSRKTALASYKDGECLRLAILKGAPWQTVKCILRCMSMLAQERLEARNGGNTPNHMAMMTEGPPSVEVIQKGLNWMYTTNKPNKEGDYPSHIAIKRENDDVPKEMWKALGDADKRDKSGKSAVFYAVERGKSVETIQALLSPCYTIPRVWSLEMITKDVKLEDCETILHHVVLHSRECSDPERVAQIIIDRYDDAVNLAWNW